MKLPLASILALVTLPALAQTPAAPSDSTPVTPTPVAQPVTSAPPAPAADQGAPSVPQSLSARENKLTATLTPEEKQRVMEDKTKVMTADPDLQAEQMDLMQKGMALQDGSATEADQQAFKEQFKEYLAKVRVAMIKLDPTIEPVLKKIEAQSTALQAKHEAAAPDSQ